MIITKPADFDAYWDRLREELEAIRPAPERELSLLRSTDFASLWFTHLTSVGSYRIFAYLSIPHGEGTFPALLQTPRYGSVNHVPHWNDRQRYVVLTLMHRGQRLADQPYKATYPGLLTDGIESPETYIYRGIVADCLRGAEYLLSRPEVHGRPAAVVGDDLAVLTAAMVPGFSTLHVTGTMFYQMIEAAARTEAYPLEEISEYCAYYPASRDNVVGTVSYFDAQFHAPAYRGAVLVNESDPGALGGPEWIDPLCNAFPGRVDRYRLTHEGGTDNDATDRWMSNELGSDPRPRLWPEALQ